MRTDYAFPKSITDFIGNASVTECTFRDGKLYFVDKENGYFLKITEKGTQKNSAAMTQFLSENGFAPRVMLYESDDSDYMITEKAEGVNGISPLELASPEKLCRAHAKALRRLHDMPLEACPVADRLEIDISEMEKKYAAGSYDPWLLDYVGIPASDTAYAYDYFRQNKSALKKDAIIHGDACLPNIILTQNSQESDFNFSAFIDLGASGVSDRHFDLLWAIWSLGFNLKTEKYRDYFLDCYGRDAFSGERLKLCGIVAALGY